MTEFLISEFLATMPFRVFAYIPFRDHLRVRLRILALILLLVEAVSLLCSALVLKLGVPLSYANLVFLPLALMVFFTMVKMERGKVAFMYIFTMAYVLLVRGISGYLSQLLFAVSDGAWQFGITTLAVFLITMPFMVRYINRTAEMVFETEAPDRLAAACCPSLLTTAQSSRCKRMTACAPPSKEVQEPELNRCASSRSNLATRRGLHGRTACSTPL